MAGRRSARTGSLPARSATKLSQLRDGRSDSRFPAAHHSTPAPSDGRAVWAWSGVALLLTARVTTTSWRAAARRPAFGPTADCGQAPLELLMRSLIQPWYPCCRAFWRPGFLLDYDEMRTVPSPGAAGATGERRPQHGGGRRAALRRRAGTATTTTLHLTPRRDRRDPNLLARATVGLKSTAECDAAGRLLRAVSLVRSGSFTWPPARQRRTPKLRYTAWQRRQELETLANDTTLEGVPSAVSGSL